MLIQDVAKLSPFQRFIYWIKERHNIYQLRQQKKKKPWTDDVVLQSNFFTNPYREHDKVTKYVKKYVRDPLYEDPRVIFAVIAARWFNWPETIEILLGDGAKKTNLLTNWDCKKAIQRLEEQRSAGLQVFTGAYNISNSGSTKPKINRVCEDYIQPVWEDRQQLMAFFTDRRNFQDDEHVCQTMQAAHKAIRRYPGLGGSGFMAYEVVCDLRYTGMLDCAVDKCEWSNPGPGAKRGINRLLERDLKHSVKDWPQKSLELFIMTIRHLKDKVPPLEMREIEHSLCEFDKYERARLGDGHMKRKYKGV